MSLIQIYMFYIYLFTLFAVTLLGGLLPIKLKQWSEERNSLLLAFSGTFLLSICLLHLIPENIAHHYSTAPVLILLGFIFQFLLQRLTHGIEHGHIHAHGDDHAKVNWGLFLGLSIHAFSEGLPLGVDYHDQSVFNSIFLAIILHKLPEVILLSSLLLQNKVSKLKTIGIVIAFSSITPIAMALTKWVEINLGIIENALVWCLPIVAGSFLQISTTILYESGTKNHHLKAKKWAVILLGFGLAFLTNFFGGTHQH